MTPATTRRVLVVDAVGCALLGVAALVVAAPLALALDVATLVVVVLGVVFVLYGVDNALVARRPRRSTLATLAVVDLAFAAVALGVAVAAPFGADVWARWLLVAVVDASLIMGALKLVGLRSLRTSSGTGIRRAPARQPVES